jgi:hypothetical protein
VLRAQGIDAEIVKGENSQFDVLEGDRLVFSKQAEGRFPDDDEIVSALSS